MVTGSAKGSIGIKQWHHLTIFCYITTYVLKYIVLFSVAQAYRLHIWNINTSSLICFPRISANFSRSFAGYQASYSFAQLKKCLQTPAFHFSNPRPFINYAEMKLIIKLKLCNLITVTNRNCCTSINKDATAFGGKENLYEHWFAHRKKIPNGYLLPEYRSATDWSKFFRNIFLTSRNTVSKLIKH